MSSTIRFLFILFAFATFLKPACFDIFGFNAINTFFNISRAFVAIVIFIQYLFIDKKVPSKLLKSELWVFVCWFFSTLFAGEGLSRFFIFSVSILSLTMLIELLIEHQLKSLIHALFVIYFILITVNLVYLISIFGFTINIEENAQSLYNFYTENALVSLLSSVNTTASYLFPALCSAILLMLLTTKKNLFAWLLIVEIFCTVMILWSATSLTGVFLIVMYVLFVYKTKRERWIKPKFLICTILLLGIGITFFKIQYLFSFIIEDILHKDLTMTGRTNVWNIGFDGFFSSPILGCGFISKTIDNGYVQLLFMGGIIGTIAYFTFLFLALKAFCKNRIIHLERFFSFVVAVILLMFIAESWPQFMGLYIIIALACNASKIEVKLSATKQHEKNCRIAYRAQPKREDSSVSA